jgi:hypothetical protein
MNSAIAGDLQQAMYVMSPAFTNVGFREERLANGNAPSLEKSAQRSFLVHLIGWIIQFIVSYFTCTSCRDIKRVLDRWN